MITYADYVSSVIVIPSTGSSCSLIVGDFAIGIKLFDVANCVDVPSYTTSGDAVSDYTSSNFERSQIGLIAGVTGAVGVLAVTAIVLAIVLLKRKKKGNSKEAVDIELTSPILKDIEVVGNIGRGNFGGI